MIVLESQRHQPDLVHATGPAVGTVTGLCFVLLGPGLKTLVCDLLVTE